MFCMITCPDFVFFEGDEREIFVDASPNASGQSSY